MQFRLRHGLLFLALLGVAAFVIGHPFPPFWLSGNGPAVHYSPVPWPSEPVNPQNCGDQCGDWKPYTRFRNSITDPRVQDPSNGGTAPQNYVNVSSSCSDKAKPSIYYYLHKDSIDPAKDVLMFRWRVEQPAHNYATGPSAGNYSSSNPWSSALWTVLFDIDGSGYRSLAAHLNGSSGSPAEPIDLLAGIWSNTPSQSLDYVNDPNVHLLGHNPTALLGASNKVLNFQNSLTPTETWPNGAAETNWDYGTTRAKKIVTSPCTEYFIDYQVPVAMLDATGVGGPKITRDTPIAMLFCTANSLNNPFQKDCAINRSWVASTTVAAPFGDYLSFNKDDAYQQPIVSSVTAQPPNTCPGTYKLSAKVQDALALNNGVVSPSLKAVDFYYWYDRDGDGNATVADTGSTWTRITPTATLTPQTLNTWTANWDAGNLAKGKYLIGVQAVDDATVLDDNMTSTGVDNRTFSYLSGDGENRIYIADAWIGAQQAQFPVHSPVQSPSAVEDWYGNPSVTGNQVALVGTAINVCGLAPTIALNATPASVATGGIVNFTVTITNPSANSNAITVESIDPLLPAGFTYRTGTSSGVTSADPSVAGQQLSWTFGSPLSVSPGASATLTFSTFASGAAGTYNGSAGAATSFGDLNSAPVSIVVDAARLSLTMSPSAYSVAADGATQLTFTLNYINDSSVGVTLAGITNPLPSGAAYVSCSGGTSCGNGGGNVTFTIGALAAGATGSVSYTLTVPNSWSTSSLTNSATLSATAPDASIVNAAASTTIAVTGLAGGGATAAAMRLTKTASASSVAPGGSITYTLTFENYGDGSASSVVLTDTLPSGMAYSSCSGTCANNSGVVTWNIGTVAAGASGSRTVTVTAANPFVSSNPTRNDASLAWSGGTPVTDQASVGVTGQACSTYYFRNTTTNVGFDGTKRTATTSPVPVAGDAGSVVSATAPVSGASYLEVLRFYQDPLTPNDVPFNGNITSSIYIDRSNGQGLWIRATVYDYNATTGAKTQLGQTEQLFQGSTKGLLSVTVTPSGTLGKGHRLLWVYDARSNHNSQTVQAEFQFGGTVTNGISGGTTFANSNAQYCVTPPANLVLDNSVDVASITENSTPTLKYTLKYANTGSASATNLSLVGALPSGFTSCQYSTDNSTWNTCSNAGASPPSHTFTIASLSGGSSGTVYVRGVVPANTAGPATLTSTATLVSDQTTQVSATANTAVTVAASGTAALAVNLAANRTTASPGQNVVYTATVVNVGDGAATNVVLSNVLPATAYYTYAGCTGGCTNNAGTVTWPAIATLGAGASQVFTYTMAVGTSNLPAGITVLSDDAGATATGGLSATSSSVNVTLNGNPSLQATFTPTPATGLKPGDAVTYTLAVENTGAAAAAGVNVSATIPAHSTFTSSPTGSFDAVNNAVVFDMGALAAGANGSVSFVVGVNTPLDSGPTYLISTAKLSASNSALQTLTATATANAAADLFISNTAPAFAPLPSAVLTAVAGGTTLFVDRSDRLALGQLIKVGNDVATITSLGARTVGVDSAINAASGTAVYGSVKLTIAYRNDGDANASAVAIREALPVGLGYYSADPAAVSSPITGNSGDVDWNIGTVNAGASGTLQVTTFPTGATGSFTSTATIEAANATTRTADAVIAIGGLSVTKTTSTPVLSAGDAANYSIVTTNSLGSAVQVDVTDVLPEGFVYQDGSALVAGNALEPTFDSADTDHLRPRWSGVQVPASGSLVISFKADVSAGAGAVAYQNELQVDAPANVAVMPFDPLSTTAEDVTVLAAGEGVVKGYVFRRFSNTNSNYNAAVDAPLAGVRVEVHKPTYDCVAGTDCYVTYTDNDGYFERVAAAGSWIVSVIPGSGALDANWTQVAGANDDSVSIPAQGVVNDHNGYRAVGAMHAVTATAGTGGSISPGGATVEEGDSTQFTVTPGNGYVIDSVIGCSGTLNGSTYTTGPIVGDCTVDATFALSAYSVTASAGAGGAIAPGNASVSHGGTTSFTVTPDAGYSIGTVSGCSGVLAGNVYTTAAVTAACAVTASFVHDTLFVTASAGAGGTIAPAGISVSSGGTASFNVTPAAGHSIANVFGCGGSLAGSTYTTGAVTASCTVTATFAANFYTVSASAGTGGTISPAAVSVAAGATTTFTLATSDGYRVASVSGCGGTLTANTYTTQAISGDCAITANFTTLGPSIATPAPARINARSLFTAIPQTLAPLAVDANDAPLSVVLVDGPLQLVPGRHIVTWRATDAAGRTVSVDQQIDIWPMVSLGPDLVLPYDSAGTFAVMLNGAAPVYPYTIGFEVAGGGYGTKHTLASGSATFESGTETTINFDTLPQAGSPPDHSLTVTLDPTENIGERGELKILLHAANIAPQVSIVASQADRIGTLLAKDGGMVTLHAVVTDPNTADTHRLQWSMPAAALVQVSADGAELSFDPQQFAVGPLTFGVVATDDGNPQLSARTTAQLALRETSVVLGGGDANENGIPDDVEGASDAGNGIPNYLNRIGIRNVLPEDAPVVTRYLIESEAGVRLRVGAAAQLQGTTGGARIAGAKLSASIPADEVDNVGGYFSFEARELAQAGTSLRSIVPQRAPIPAQPVYRLWDQESSRWKTFAEDSQNRLESAPGEPGFCPGADSTSYSAGLTPGHLCVRITIQDGGVNDLDHQTDATIMTTGGVAEKVTVVVTGTSSGSGGGGGGSLNAWAIAGLLLIAVLRRARRKTASTMLVALCLPLTSLADGADHELPRKGWVLGANAMLVAGSVDADEMDARIARRGYQTQTSLSGQTRAGGMLYGGYRWRRLGLEAAYVDLGKMTTRVSGNTPLSDEYLLAISESHPQSGSGPQFSVIGYLPLGERFEAMGRFGTFYWRSNMSAQGRSRYQDVDDRAFDPVIGLGLNYRVAARWSASAQLLDYRLNGERISALSIGVVYRLRGESRN